MEILLHSQKLDSAHERGALTILDYLRQLIIWGIPILLRDNVRKFLKPLGLGIMHALLNQLGYLDRKYIS